MDKSTGMITGSSSDYHNNKIYYVDVRVITCEYCHQNVLIGDQILPVVKLNCPYCGAMIEFN